MTLFTPNKTSESTTSTLNDRIKRAIKQQGISQKMLAEYLGVERETVTRHLTGKQCNSIALLKAVHKLTGTNYHWLLEGEGVPFPPSSEETTHAQNQREELLRAFQNKMEEEFKKRGL